jgi:hypothetical protein
MPSSTPERDRRTWSRSRSFDPVTRKRAPADLTAGGWGLRLFDQLCDRWGVDFSHSTRVWLEFDRH